MRTMVKFTLPTQETNPLVDDGSVGQKMETLLGKLQPETAYFGPVDGKRGGFIVINMEEESEVVTKLEPLWLELNATVETFPVATPDELRAGEVSSRVVDRLLRSRGGLLLLATFYQLSVLELGSCSHQCHQVRSG